MDAARLPQIPLFAGLTEDERAEIAACMREVTVDAGTTLASEGDNAYELRDRGRRRRRAQGRRAGQKARPRRRVRRDRPAATGTRTASVVATSQMQLAAMFSREYKQLEGRMPELGKSLRETMARRVAETSF